MNNAARGNENALNNVTDIINQVLYFLILKFFCFSITEIIIFANGESKHHFSYVEILLYKYDGNHVL